MSELFLKQYFEGNMQLYIYLSSTSSRKTLSWALMAHACDPSNKEAGIKKAAVQGQPGQIVCKNLQNKD
jgi:hypothetical protein